MKSMIKIIMIAFLSGIILLTGCNKSDNYVVNQLNESIDYFEKSEREISNIAREKDKEKMIVTLEEVIIKINEYVDYFLVQMYNDDNPQNIKDACMNVKTGLYGVSTQGFEPMLKVFKGESDEVPSNYLNIISSGYDYIEKAKKLINE